MSRLRKSHDSAFKLAVNYGGSKATSFLHCRRCSEVGTLLISNDTFKVNIVVWKNLCDMCVFRGYFRKTCTCNLYRSKHCLIHYFSLDRLLSTMSSPSKPYWHADFKGSCRIQLFTTKSGWLKKEERTTTTSSSYRQSRGRNLESSLTLLLMLPAMKGAQTLLLSP